MPKSVIINHDKLAEIKHELLYDVKTAMLVFGYKTAAGIYNAVKAGIFPAPCESVGEKRKCHKWSGSKIIAEAERRASNG